ncbi:MAG: hypothetical protein KKD39_03595, partial [Candidatus Altiarchaeota archaeon]|nr:hypothetical protein [Candidatus Altiarchaeota archaeon]
PSMRFSGYQLDASDWIEKNTPSDSDLVYVGYVQRDLDWFTALSSRRFGTQKQQHFIFQDQELQMSNHAYVYFDLRVPYMGDAQTAKMIQNLKSAVTNYSFDRTVYETDEVLIKQIN